MAPIAIVADRDANHWRVAARLSKSTPKPSWNTIVEIWAAASTHELVLARKAMSFVKNCGYRLLRTSVNHCCLGKEGGKAYLPTPVYRTAESTA